MKFDMHCHTKAGSIDSKISIERYIELLQEKGFDGMLVTDHDSYKGYRYWQQNKAEMPDDFVVLMGCLLYTSPCKKAFPIRVT